MPGITRTYHHRLHGPQDMYTVDGDAAVAAHPNEWSTKPWTDAEAKKAEEADRKAQERDAEIGGRPTGRVPNDAPDHAVAVKDQPPKPAALPGGGEPAPGVKLPVTDGIAANAEGAQPSNPSGPQLVKASDKAAKSGG